jgi:dienelactone hydrolase
MFRGAARILGAVQLGVVFSFTHCHAAEDAAIAPSASMNERVLSVPGDPERPATLVVTVVTPDGAGPFPLVVMNHGAAGTPRPDREPRYHFTFSAYYFLSRGYAVALPMMRGFAGSEGRQMLEGCNQLDVGISNAKDIRAVIDCMVKEPYIDGERIIVAGQSFGGWNVLAFGSLNRPNVKGLINFAGGANISNCRSNPSALAQAAQDFGYRTKIPSIWFYGDNDSKFSPAVWRDMHAAYTAVGGKAELDSHNFLGFPESLRIWAPNVDAFLARIGLPNAITHPEYLPMDFPPPSHYAAIDDVDAVPYLNEEGKKTYRRYLSDPMPKVFVLSPAGLSASFNGGFDPLGRAMKACREHGHKCQVYAADDDVTWVRPTPALAPTGFAPVTDATAVPYLKDGGRTGYEKYLTLRKPKAFVVAPDGAWFFSTQGDDPLASALTACGKQHQGCQLYAVDDNVVWSSH